MTIRDFVRVKIAERGINQSTLAESAGFKRQSNISTMLRKGKSINTNNLFALLDALNCEMVLRDKITGVENIVSKEEPVSE